MGRLLLKRCGLSKYIKVIEQPSYTALPELVKKKAKFELIYIDGWHTFDYTLVDFFYADLLLEVGGVIVLDDIRHKGVKKLFQYVINNYPHFKLITNTPCYRQNKRETDWAFSTQATFLKLKGDERPWNFHKEF